MKKSKLLIIFALALVSAINLAAAKTCKDYSHNDYEKVMRGEKRLKNALLEGANLSGMDLRGVDFRGAELEKVNFKGANLAGVNFEKADLEDANLKGANIEGANFNETELEDAVWIDGRTCAEGSIGGCW